MYAILPTGRVQSQVQRPDPLRPQHRLCACRIAIGHSTKSGCPFLYAILSTEESNRRFSVHTPSDCSIDHALVAWQSGILQNQSARFCIHPLLTGESNRRFSAYSPSDCSIGHALVAWQSGILQSPGARFLYAILPTEESNHRLSAYPPSDCSIGHALVA